MLEPETEPMTDLRCVLQVFQEKFWREKKKLLLELNKLSANMESEEGFCTGLTFTL